MNMDILFPNMEIIPLNILNLLFHVWKYSLHPEDLRESRRFKGTRNSCWAVVNFGTFFKPFVGYVFGCGKPLTS